MNPDLSLILLRWEIIVDILFWNFIPACGTKAIYSWVWALTSVIYYICYEQFSCSVRSSRCFVRLLLFLMRDCVQFFYYSLFNSTVQDFFHSKCNVTSYLISLVLKPLSVKALCSHSWHHGLLNLLDFFFPQNYSIMCHFPFSTFFSFLPTSSFPFGEL